MVASLSSFWLPAECRTPLVDPSNGTRVSPPRSEIVAAPPHDPRRILERVSHAIAARHYSRRTEKAYVGWIRRYIAFHPGRAVAEMGEVEVTRFLSTLVTRGQVTASTQNQALSALLFVYRLRGAPRKRYYV